MKSLKVAVPFVVSIVASFACQPDVGAVVDSAITGTVVAGPVGSADVAAYSVDKAGRKKDKLASAQTKADGTFALDVGGQAGPTLVCASHGTFNEEATGGVVDLGPNELCALVDNQQLGQTTAGVVITPFTNLQAHLASCYVDARLEDSLDAASKRSASRLNDFFAQGVPGFDLRATPVFDATANTAPSLSGDVWHGLLLSGLSESARQTSIASNIDPGVRVTSATMSTALARDIDDARCVFDGQGPGGVVLTEGNVALSANTLRGAPQGLALGVEAFLRSPSNKSGVTVDSVADLTIGLSSFTSDIFAADAVPPTITFTAPIAGSVAGKPPIVVDATDDVAIATIAFTAPQALVGTGTTTCATPGHCSLTGVLNTGLFPAGALTITARATNTAGVSSDAALTVTINNVLPTIEVTSPSEGTVQGNVIIHGAASSALGVSSFSVDVPGTTFLPACNPPATTTNCDRELDPNTVDILWDTTTATEGAHTITLAATDTSGNTSFERIDVVIDNVPAATIAGIVDLGYPVVGAQASVFELGADGARGALIGQATTDDHGAYQIVNPEYEGAIEVSATGGTFTDSATGLTLSLRSGQELVADLSSVVQGVAAVANVNAWTTLAAVRAHATSTQSPSFAGAIDFNANLFASHLLRPGSLSLTSSTSSDLLTQTPAPSDSSAILALGHAGLSRLAAQASLDGGGAPGQVTLVDAIDELKADLQDGVLDGTNNGAALFLDGQHVAMDSYTLRTTLADRIDAFVKNAPLVQNGAVVLAGTRNSASTITSAALSAPGLLYDDVAEDRSVLFPADVPTRPFDHTPPTISLTFAAPNQTAHNGDTLNGAVAVVGAASDSSGVASFDVRTPGNVADQFSSVEDLRVEIDGSIAPNRADVTSECNIDIAAPPLSLPDPDRQVCVCAEAADDIANIADDALCFTRPRPVVTTSVVDFIGPAVPGIDVHAAGSFNLTGCVASLAQGGASVGGAQSGATGSTCDLHVPFGAPLTSGAADLSVSVTEIGGAVTTSDVPYTVDVTSPSLVITNPAAGAFLAAAPHVGVSVSDANLRSLTLDVTTSSTPIVSGAQAIVGPAGAAAFDPFIDLQPDGLRTIKVTAVDAAGNQTVASRTYTKDSTAPALVALAAADGDPLQSFQLTATTAFTASSQCSQFPFTGCVFNIASTTPTVSVPLRTQSSTVDTYRRWQHLAGTITNPSTLANPAAENRAPTLRLKTDPAVTVEARIDATCPSDSAFANRSRATFTANNLGLVDVPIADSQNLTASPTLLREQLGTGTLCMSLRPLDQAGNVGAIVHHFFKYEATPAPLFMVFNAGPYDPATFVDDVGSLDNGHDDKALSGSGQGTAGRVFSHAYLVSPSTTTSYNYTYALNSGDAPSMKVKHRETVQVSKTRAFNWCFTTENGGLATDHDDQLANPDFDGADEVGSPPDEPFWYGSNFLGHESTAASWALYVPTGGNLLGANTIMEHVIRPSGEQDTTVAFSPASSYSTSSNTTTIDLERTFTVPLPTVKLDAWSFNTVTGQPDNLVSSGSTVSFTAGGSSNASRNVLLLFRAPVPTNAITLKTANVLDGQSGTLGFNSSCDARTAAGTIVGQSFRLADNHWVVADASIPASSVEPATPRSLLWVKSGQFPYCDGTSSHDCRYGRYFDDYESAAWSWAAGRALAPSAKIGAVSGAPVRSQSSQAIPAVVARALAQEP